MDAHDDVMKRCAAAWSSSRFHSNPQLGAQMVLDALRPGDELPGGLVVVGKVPTEKMLKAGSDEFTIGASFRAMLAAAKERPVSDRWLNTQIIAESARMFGLGAAQDDARIAQAEARGFLAGREAAAKVADEDEALYTGEAIEAAVAKRIRDAIRALESPKGGDAT